MQIKHRLFAKKIDFISIPLQYPHHSVITSKGYAWDKHGMVTEKIGITKIEESYK